MNEVRLVRSHENEKHAPDTAGKTRMRWRNIQNHMLGNVDISLIPTGVLAPLVGVDSYTTYALHE